MYRKVIEGLKYCYGYFRSPKVTVFLISALIVLFVGGLVIPQKRFYQSKAQFDQWHVEHPLLSGVINSLQLNEIYVAPVTLFFLGLFFLNLLVVLAHRVPFVLRRCYLADRKTATSGLEKLKDDPRAMTIMIHDGSPAKEELLAEKAARFFRKRFWSVIFSEERHSFVAVKNRFSPFGFLLFHVSFLFFLIGGLLIMYTRFSGNLALTEGEQFSSDIKQFSVIKSEPKIFHALPGFGMRLLRVTPSYVGSVGTDLDVAMEIESSQKKFETVLKVNHPVRIGAISILPENVDFAPLFILREKGGEELQGIYFSLYVLKGGEDSFEFAGVPYKIYVRFYPDFEELDGKPGTRSLAIRNPVFHIRVEKEGKILYEGNRVPGEWAAFDNFELSCSEIRYWVDFLVVREYGEVPLSLGFLLGVAGLTLRLIFFQKTVRVHIRNCDGRYALFIGGRSESFQHSFRDELGHLGSGLHHYLKEAGLNVITESNTAGGNTH